MGIRRAPWRYFWAGNKLLRQLGLQLGFADVLGEVRRRRLGLTAGAEIGNVLGRFFLRSLDRALFSGQLRPGHRRMKAGGAGFALLGCGVDLLQRLQGEVFLFHFPRLVGFAPQLLSPRSDFLPTPFLSLLALAAGAHLIEEALGLRGIAA